MNTRVLAGLLLGATGGASGQSGTLDQVSPSSGPGATNFNIDASFLTWQAQINPGITGQVEGIRIGLQGEPGAQFGMRVRTGPGPSANPSVFEGTFTKTVSGIEVMFVTMTGSNITQSAGQPFVMELQGNGTGMWITGTYVPPPGTPNYPAPLFLNGSNYADGGWRIGLETFVLPATPCYPDCNADGVLNLSDFGCFTTKFALADPYADCNDDGNLNLGDFGCFQTKFALGCP